MKTKTVISVLVIVVLIVIAFLLFAPKADSNSGNNLTNNEEIIADQEAANETLADNEILTSEVDIGELYE